MAVDPPVSLTRPLPPDLSQKLPKLIPRRASKDAASNITTAEPPPSTPPLPSILNNIQEHIFATPVRRIITPHDHELFLASETYQSLLGVVFGLSDSVRGLCISDVAKDKEKWHPTVKIALGILKEAETLLEQHPPEETGSRFGNKVFRDYMGAVDGKMEEWHARFSRVDDDRADQQATQLPSAAILEVSTYLSNSFGSAERLDYGSGHELNFVCWLLSLYRLGLFSTSPSPDTSRDQSTLATLALVVFPAYWKLMRKVQGAYYLEPAGSHGVWGLDDYQFLPFLFGAAQFVPPEIDSSSTSSTTPTTTTTRSSPDARKSKNSFLTPKSIHSQLMLDDYGAEYLYLGQVAWINSVKNVEGLRWHSPMLDDISAAKSWTKIEGGMKKMFVAEVLGKRAVMQHFLFGSLVPAVEGMSAAGLGDEELEEERCHGDVGEDGVVRPHVHEHDDGWNDPCGIKVPGAVGAAREERKKGVAPALRRLPFD